MGNQTLKVFYFCKPIFYENLQLTLLPLSFLFAFQPLILAHKNVNHWCEMLKISMVMLLSF